jgi:hypothetical protein
MRDKRRGEEGSGDVMGPGGSGSVHQKNGDEFSVLHTAKGA